MRLGSVTLSVRPPPKVPYTVLHVDSISMFRRAIKGGTQSERRWTHSGSHSVGMQTHNVIPKTIHFSEDNGLTAKPIVIKKTL